MSTTDSDATAGNGAVQAAISEEIVGVHRDYLGRGPGRVRTTISNDIVTILMEDVLTRAERSLVDDGKSAEVMAVRQSFQQTMRDDIVSIVERHTRRRSVAFMSANHVDPDLSCEIVILDAE